MPTSPEHEAHAVGGIAGHHRIFGVALREPVPGGEAQRVPLQHLPVTLARVRPAALQQGPLPERRWPDACERYREELQRDSLSVAACRTEEHTSELQSHHDIA